MGTLIEKITAAYETDRASVGRKVVNALQLPKCYESITPEWLTEILCSRHSGAAVTDYQLGVPDKGSSNRRKIYLEYNQRGVGQGLKRAVFCKATHDLNSRILLGVLGAARSEAIFYNTIRPVLSIETPHSLLARFEPESFNSMIVLPDLSDSVREFCTDTTSITRERAFGQLELLASVHGRCYQRRDLEVQLAALPTWPQLFANGVTLGLGRRANQGFLGAKGVIPPRLYRQFSRIWPSALASVERHLTLPQTLIHGDVHLKNWYIASSGAMGLTDWQTCSRGHWSRDVAHTMSALPVEERRAWEEDLLRFYVDRLQACGGPAVSLDEAWLHYRQQLVSTLIWWTVTLSATRNFPDVDPGNTTLEFVRRSAIAVDELDSLASFQDSPRRPARAARQVAAS
jgi:hypothetical protein